MRLKFFQVPVGGDRMVEEELNRLLRAHRVLRVEREMTRREGAPAWAVGAVYGTRRTTQAAKVSWKKTVLPPDEPLFLALKNHG